jgi:hypothetical protein
MRLTSAALLILLNVSALLSARDEPTAEPTGYDPSVDIGQLNRFIADNCHIDTSNPYAPPKEVLKRRCRGSVDSKCVFELDDESGYGSSGKENGFTIPFPVEHVKFDCHDLEIADTQFLPDSIALSCKKERVACFSFKENQIPLTSYNSSEQLPLVASNSQLVEAFLRPLERLATPDHTDTQTCQKFHCAK